MCIFFPISCFRGLLLVLKPHVMQLTFICQLFHCLGLFALGLFVLFEISNSLISSLKVLEAVF